MFYRPAGKVADLFQPLGAKNDVWDLTQAKGTTRPDSGGDSVGEMLRVSDTVPAATRLDAVALVISNYQMSEPDLGAFLP